MDFCLGKLDMSDSEDSHSVEEAKVNPVQQLTGFRTLKQIKPEYVAFFLVADFGSKKINDFVVNLALKTVAEQRQPFFLSIAILTKLFVRYFKHHGLKEKTIIKTDDTLDKYFGKLLDALEEEDADKTGETYGPGTFRFRSTPRFVSRLIFTPQPDIDSILQLENLLDE